MLRIPAALLLFCCLIATALPAAAAERYEAIPAPPRSISVIEPTPLGGIAYRRLPESLRPTLEALLGKGINEAAPEGEAAPVPGTEVYAGLEGELSDLADAPALPTVNPEAFAIRFVTGKPSRLILSAATPEGLFLAARRLHEHLSGAPESRYIDIAELKDYPSFPVRGVIEGFYGRPWSEEERLEMLRFMGRTGLNYYFWAPKDDPAHRKGWRAAHSLEELAALARLEKTARGNGIRFAYGISPGLSIVYSDQADYEAMLAKVNSVLALGIRDIALLMDDISYDLRVESDKKAFQSLAEAQTKLANRLYTEMKHREPQARLFFCPTRYFSPEPEKLDYLKEVGSGLNPEIDIFWTGVRVYSPAISLADANRVGAVLRRKPLYWDNFPVNDYIRSRLHLGPLLLRDPELPAAARGLVMNPMNQAEASKIALYTAAAYLWNPRAYRPHEAWTTALRFAGGETARPYLQNLAARLSGSAHWPEGVSKDLKTRLERLRSDHQAGNAQQALLELDAWMAGTLDACRGLRRELDNPALLTELEPLLTRLEKTTLTAESLLPLYLPAAPAPGLERLATAERQLAEATAGTNLKSPDMDLLAAFIKETTAKFSTP